MVRLDSATRARLPNRAFAYVDSQGRRRLPIYDAAHVRAALARFNQVSFEDEAARDRARTRVLGAAKKYGIVPLGFIDGQLRSERAVNHLERGASLPLPTGFVTMLMTDIEGSTALVRRLDEGYRELISEVRDLLRSCVSAVGGFVIEARADEFFAVFEHPLAGVDAAVRIQRDFTGRKWVDDVEVRVRVGVHCGYPTLAENNYVGMAVHLAARVCSAAHGGQIVASGDTKLALKGSLTPGVRFRSLGLHSLRGIPEPVPLFQVTTAGLASKFPPLRTM